MFLLCVLVLVHTAYCQDICTTEPIILEDINNDTQLIGKWSKLYHWSSDNNPQPRLCPVVQIDTLNEEDVKKMIPDCNNDNLKNAKLKILFPALQYSEGLMKTPENGTWMATCTNFKIKFEKVTDDFIKGTTTGRTTESGLMGKKDLSSEELECLIQRIPVEDNMKGHHCD